MEGPGFASQQELFISVLAMSTSLPDMFYFFKSSLHFKCAFSQFFDVLAWPLLLVKTVIGKNCLKVEHFKKIVS